jgi:hypothetical protein
MIVHKPAHAAETGPVRAHGRSVIACGPRQAACNAAVPEMFDALGPDAVITVAYGLILSIINHM